MSANLLSSMGRIGRAALACAAMIVAAPGFANTDQAPVTAVFKAHEIDFFYRSAVVAYPCHELQSRVANILLAIGARDDIQVRASGCEFVMRQFEEDEFERWDGLEGRAEAFRGNRNTDREQSAHVRVRLQMPVEVTPEVLAEIDRDRSRRELVSRVTRNPAAALNDPIVFEAQRQEVTLKGRLIRLEPKDCHLLEQMTTSVFRELDVKVVKRNFTCDRYQKSRVTPQLTVEALLPTGQLRPLPEPEDVRKDEAVPPTPGDATPAEVATDASPE